MRAGFVIDFQTTAAILANESDDHQAECKKCKQNYHKWGVEADHHPHLALTGIITDSRNRLLIIIFYDIHGRECRPF